MRKKQFKNGQFHLKPAQLEKLLNAAKSPRDKLVIRILIDTGMRRGECAKLEISDFRFKKNAVRVIGKGDKERLIPIGDSLKQEINFFIKDRKFKKGWLFPSSHKTSKYGHITAETINKIVGEAGQDAGLKNPNPALVKINPHILRHSFAYKYKTILGLDALAMVLGHESPATTAKIYGLPNFEDICKLMAQQMESEPRPDPNQTSILD